LTVAAVLSFETDLARVIGGASATARTTVAMAREDILFATVARITVTIFPTRRARRNFLAAPIPADTPLWTAEVFTHRRTRPTMRIVRHQIRFTAVRDVIVAIAEAL
jgi:hypothetical protein